MTKQIWKLCEYISVDHENSSNENHMCLFGGDAHVHNWCLDPLKRCLAVCLTWQIQVDMQGQLVFIVEYCQKDQLVLFSNTRYTCTIHYTQFCKISQILQKTYYIKHQRSIWFNYWLFFKEMGPIPWQKFNFLKAPLNKHCFCSCKPAWFHWVNMHHFMMWIASF